MARQRIVICFVEHDPSKLVGCFDRVSLAKELSAKVKLNIEDETSMLSPYYGRQYLSGQLLPTKEALPP